MVSLFNFINRNYRWGVILLISTLIITSRTHKHNFEILDKKQNIEAEAITNALITELQALKIIFEHEFVPKYVILMNI